MRSMRNLLRKPLLEKGRADWVSELPSVIKHYNNTIHSSIKTTPIQASKRINEKVVNNNLKCNREVQKPKFKLGQLVRLADTKRVFSKGGSTNWSYNFIQKPKSYMILFLHIQLIIHPYDIIKTYCYQQNQPWMKIVQK